MIDSRTRKNRDGWILEDIVAAFPGVQSKSFNTDADVTAEEIFDVAAAAPGVIAANVMIIRAKHRVAFTGTLHDVQQPKIRIVFRVGESISGPEIHVPFAIAVPLRAGRHIRDLLHFFSGILS